MKRILWLTLALGLPLSPAAAQDSSPYLGANITRTYALDDVASRPGLLQLGKSDMLVVELPDDVAAVVTPQASMLDLPEPLGNLLVMTGKVSRGNAQLFVQLENGKSAYFMVQFKPGGNGMKRIRVLDEPKLTYAQPLPAANAGMPVFTAPQAAAPIIATPAVPATPAPWPDLPAQVNALKSGAVAPITRLQPDWLRLTARLQNDPRGDSLSVTVTNHGPRPLQLTAQDLSLTQNGRQLDVTTEELVTVRPGEARRVNVKLTARHEPGSELRLDWLAFDAAAHVYYRASTTGW